MTRTRSCQKEPTVALPRRTRPRTSTAKTHSPLAAEKKFCTVRPRACDNGESVVSPEYDCQLVFVTKLAAVLRAISQGTAGRRSGFQGRRGWQRRRKRSRPKPAAWKRRIAIAYSVAVISRMGQTPAARSRGLSRPRSNRLHEPSVSGSQFASESDPIRKIVVSQGATAAAARVVARRTAATSRLALVIMQTTPGQASLRSDTPPGAGCRRRRQRAWRASATAFWKAGGDAGMTDVRRWDDRKRTGVYS